MTASESAPAATTAARSITVPPLGCARARRVSRDRIASSSTRTTLARGLGLCRARDGSSVGRRADPAGGTSAPGPSAAEARCAEARSLGPMIETRGAGPRSPVGVSFPLPLVRYRREGGEVLGVKTRLSRLWRRRGAGQRSGLGAPDPGLEHRVETLEARLKHLEAELEGLQDALYRQAVLEGEHVGELRRRMAPEQLARDLSQDARRRGL